MAVARLSEAWVRAVLTENYSAGVVRKLLLDFFASQLVSSRARRGAKGRVARRLYLILWKLQVQGIIRQEEGLIHLLVGAKSPSGVEASRRDLGPLLKKLLFRAQLSEDGQGDGHTPADLLALRKEFLVAAVEAGWPVSEAAEHLGLKTETATRILAGA